MKRNIKTTLLVVAAASIMGACSTDKLDITQRGALTTDEYIDADDDECLQFIAAVYSHVRAGALQNYMSGYGCYSSVNWNLGQMAQETADQYEYSQTAQSDVYSQAYSYYYQTMYWCNMIIEYLPSNNVASSSVKAQVYAEARAVRAVTMMQVAMLWGNPPLADHIIQGDESHTDQADILDWVETELSECAEDLPSKTSKSGQSTIGGRFTKEAAYAYLGKAYLYDKEYTLAASTLYNKVISTGLYELIDDYNDLNSKASDFCSEFLWEYEFTEESGYSTSQDGAWDVLMFNWSTGGFYFPDGYYASGGWGYGAFCSDEFGEFMEAHDVEDGVKCNRYRGTIASYEDLLDEDVFTYSSGSKGFRSQISDCQGYWKIRHIPLSDDVVGSIAYFAYTTRNIPYMRYSEVLLNYAEAVAQGGTASGMTGLEALNIVRRRAGLSDAPSLSLDNETYGVKAEKRAELYDEGQRFIDLVRWGDAASELADCGKYTYTFNGYLDGDNTTIQSKDQWYIVTANTVGNGFVSGKHDLFPYPEDELSNNTNLSQNPNW